MCLSERKFDNNMRLPNGYGSVVKMSGKRRKPYMVRKTIGWHLDETKGRQIQDFQIIGYAETRAEGLRMLAEYNQNPYDVNVAKVTFSEVYERWSKYKYPIISDSNAKGYTASYKVCGILYDKPFREIKLCDLQLVVDTCGKNYPTLKKLKGLFNQVYEYAMKNDICNKDIRIMLIWQATVTRTPTSATVTSSAKTSWQDFGRTRLILTAKSL